jgi:hypothetical protein
MKDWNFKKNVKFAIGMTVGFVLYDYTFKDDIDWLGAIFAGFFIVIILWLYEKYAANKKVNNKSK